jgi:hypothetical protein
MLAGLESDAERLWARATCELLMQGDGVAPRDIYRRGIRQFRTYASSFFGEAKRHDLGLETSRNCRDELLQADFTCAPNPNPLISGIRETSYRSESGTELPSHAHSSGARSINKCGSACGAGPGFKEGPQCPKPRIRPASPADFAVESLTNRISWVAMQAKRADTGFSALGDESCRCSPATQVLVDNTPTIAISWRARELRA